MWIRSKQKKWKSEVNWNAKKKKKKKDEKWREKKVKCIESSKVMKSNPWPSCNPQESKFEPLLFISLWAKNQSLHYKPNKSPLWSIEVFVWTTIGLIPFGYVGNLVRCSHIMSIVQFMYWEFESTRFFEDKL